MAQLPNFSKYSQAQLKAIADTYGKLNVKPQENYFNTFKNFTGCSQVIAAHQQMILQYKSQGSWIDLDLATAFANIRFARYWDALSSVPVFGNSNKLTCPGNAQFISYFASVGLDLKNPISYIAAFSTALANTGVAAAQGVQALTEQTGQTATDILKGVGDTATSGLTFAKALPWIIVIGGSLLIFYLIKSGTVKEAIRIVPAIKP